jgi:[ribosomal protein S18]-alanine N-acetyltransferase
MTEVEIRSAEESDHRWAAELMAHSDPWITLGRGYDECLKACTRSGDCLLVAWLDNERAGFVIVRDNGVAGAPYIPCIAVAPSRRSGGLGAAMLAHVESMVRGHARYLFLCVSSFNTAARTFYGRHGFVPMGELPDFIVDGASELLMRKRL